MGITLEVPRMSMPNRMNIGQRLVEQVVLLTACLPSCLPACLPACLEVPRNDACRHSSDTSSVPIRIPFDIQTRSQHDADSVSRAKLLRCDVQ